MVKERIIGCIRKVWPVALKTSCWFLKIMLPVSFVVMLLTYFQVLPAVSAVVAPLFTRIGLPGDAALVFVTGIFTNIYTVIALLSNMDFTVREGILLAMMCLISHNYPVETLVQKKTGSAGWKMVLLRFTCSFIAAAVLNLILPEFARRMIAQPSVDLGFRDTLFNWLQTSLWLSLKVVALITGLMILQRLLEEFGILKWISSLLGPGMQLLGLPRQVAFLWVVGNTLGLAYGSAVLMDYARQGKLSGDIAFAVGRSFVVCRIGVTCRMADRPANIIGFYCRLAQAIGRFYLSGSSNGLKSKNLIFLLCIL